MQNLDTKSLSEQDNLNGQKLFSAQSQFITTAMQTHSLPTNQIPEIAFAGRSNVGKSSLLNALLQRKSLVKTSKTPGRTRGLNFFSLGESLHLVDMPGYGYAKAPKYLSQTWPKLIQNYLKGRSNLRLLCLLIDARRGLMPLDSELTKMLDKAAVPYLTILTKADKVRQHELDKVQSDTASKLAPSAAAYPFVLITSASKNIGLQELRSIIAKITTLP